MKQHRWEREKQSAGVCWYLMPIGGSDPIAAIVPNDPDSPRLRYRAEISFRGHGRRRDWDNAREARRWVEQTLADWPEWKDCEIKQRFRFAVSEQLRGIATTIIVVGGLIGFAALAVFAVGREIDWAPTTPPSPVAATHKPAADHANCRDLVRGYRVFGRVSAYPPFSEWWGQSSHIVWVYDDGRLP
jgi:hypothetical protein